MSTSQIYVITVIALAGAAICAWQVRRALREPLERDRIVHAATQGAADHDECELLYSMPAYTGDDLQGRLDRLKQAIRDQQQEGEN